MTESNESMSDVVNIHHSPADDGAMLTRIVAGLWTHCDHMRDVKGPSHPTVGDEESTACTAVFLLIA